MPAAVRRRARRSHACPLIAVAALGALLACGTADAAARTVVLKLKSKPAQKVQDDMTGDGTMGAGDMVVYMPTPLYTRTGRRVGQRGVTTMITSNPDAAGMSMAESQVNLFFGGGDAIYETLYAPGHFNAAGPPLKAGEVWRRAIIGGTGRYAGARGEDVVRTRGAWIYFTLTIDLP
ncbi:MAG: hypothetical protein ACR2JV_04280 [Gaiellales bacterium]